MKSYTIYYSLLYIKITYLLHTLSKKKKKKKKIKRINDKLKYTK
jgi:hypothetical protein